MLTLTPPACKDMANADNDNLQCGRGAKSYLGISAAAMMCYIIFVISVFVIFIGSVLLLMHAEERIEKANRPNLFIRLLSSGGLEHLASPPTSPYFQLAFDVHGVQVGYRACSGGGNSLLRVSYHGMALAWGQMPRFCINSGSSTDVATVETTAQALMLREEVRNLIWNEIQVVGRIELDVWGEVAGLGYLRCKIFILEDKTADIPKSLCLVH